MRFGPIDSSRKAVQKGSRRPYPLPKRPACAGGSQLVEECPFGDRRAPLARNLGVVRYQEEEPIRDRVHPAVERVGEAGAEVRHPPREPGVGPLEVQDHGMPALEVTG